MKKQFILFALIISGFILKAGGFYAGLPVFTYLQTDRNCYVSGDFIFLKGYHIVNSIGELSENSLYVDIVTQENVFVTGELLYLENGLASGVIGVPDSLKTGEYTIRLYTNYSRDFKTKPILFSKNIYVTNRFGNNGPLQISLSDKYLLDSNNVIIQEERVSEFIACGISDTVFSTRSKIDIDINLSNCEGFSGALSVKAVSAYENAYEIVNGMIPDVDDENSEIISDVLPVQIQNESKGLVYSGHVSVPQLGVDSPELMALIAFEDSVLEVKCAKVNRVGNFCFLMNDFTGERTAYVSLYEYPSMRLISGAEVTLDKKIIDPEGIKEFDYSREYEISRDSLNLQKALIAKAYGLSFVNEDSKALRENSFESKYLYGNISQTIEIDDYVDLPDFIQITKEILPFLKLKDKKGEKSFVVFDGVNNITRANPFIFVDGIPLTDIENILPWGSDRIKRVDMQIQPRYYGDVQFENGLVFIWTKTMDFWEKEKVKNTIVYNIEGFQRSVSFNFPNYSSESLINEPDFRQTLYWNPCVNIEDENTQNISFFTSDEKGLFEVVIEGVTEKNNKVFVKKYFHVK